VIRENMDAVSIGPVGAFPDEFLTVRVVIEDVANSKSILFKARPTGNVLYLSERQPTVLCHVKWAKMWHARCV